MSITKKKLKAIDSLSVFDDVFRETPCNFFKTFNNTTNQYEPFYENEPPSMWNDDETSLFDLMAEIERKLKADILEILTRNKS